MAIDTCLINNKRALCSYPELSYYSSPNCWHQSSSSYIHPKEIKVQTSDQTGALCIFSHALHIYIKEFSRSSEFTTEWRGCSTGGSRVQRDALSSEEGQEWVIPGQMDRQEQRLPFPLKMSKCSKGWKQQHLRVLQSLLSVSHFYTIISNGKHLIRGTSCQLDNKMECNSSLNPTRLTAIWFSFLLNQFPYHIYTEFH